MDDALIERAKFAATQAEERSHMADMDAERVRQLARDVEGAARASDAALAMEHEGRLKAESEMIRLQAELAAFKNPPAPPLPPPDPVPQPQPPPSSGIAPNVEVTIVRAGQTLIFRPTGTGERRGAYDRWMLGDLERGEIFVIVQAAYGERVVAVGRCWSDLSHLAPDAMIDLTIKLDGKAVFGPAPQVLHPHTCPRFTYFAKPYKIPLEALAAAGEIPEYIPTEIAPTPDDFRWIAAPDKWPYQMFKPPATGEFTERLGHIAVSWTGGAVGLMDGTEGAFLNKMDLLAAGSNDGGFLEAARGVAEGVGCLPFHYWDRETFRPCTPEQSTALPELSGNNLLPQLSTTTGVKHPRADVPHSPSLSYLVGRVLDDPLLRDYEAAMALVPVLCKPKDKRQAGLAPSGEVRAWAWAARRVLHLFHMSHGAEKEHARLWLQRVIHTFVVENATPGGIYYRKSGLFGTMKAKSAAGTIKEIAYIREPTTQVTTLWWLTFFSWVMYEALRAGFEEAELALLHCLRVPAGWWEACKGRSKFLAPWGNCAVAASDEWVDHFRLTFELLQGNPTSWIRPPTDNWFMAVFRANGVFAGKMGQPWGKEVVTFFDQNNPPGWLPPTWALAA